MKEIPTIGQMVISIASDIEGKGVQLEKENIANVEMHISPPEQESLDKIRIERDMEPFDVYGPVGDDLKTRLTEYLSGIGENDPADIERLSTVIHRLSMGVQNGFHEEAAWITLRVSMPNPAFDVPRWHQDGALLRCSTHRAHAACILGLRWSLP